MRQFIPPDPDYARRVRDNFNQQQLMKTIGARLVKVAPGEVRIEIPFNLAFTQQHAYMHAGIIATIVDNACGFAAYTLMPAASEVLAVEYKINFLLPAKGDRFIGIGKVIKPGRTLTVCEGRVLAFEQDQEQLIATMQATSVSLAK